MSARRIDRLRLVSLSLMVFAAIGSGCREDRTASSTAPAAVLSGNVTMDGSSTLFPVSRTMAEAFASANPGVKIAVTESGTGGGFRRLCAGEVDLIGASRPINGAEQELCRSHKIEFLELPVAFDAVTVVTNPKNTFVSCLTVVELKTIWSPAAENKVTRWNQVRASFPPQPLSLYGPGKDSGTFDYFTLAVNGTESSSRGDYTKSEDDTVLVNGVAADDNALGYFGASYYLSNANKLRLVAVDSGSGCVAPSAETVLDGKYQLLSRPLFVYAASMAAARPEVKAFVRYYLSPENSPKVQSVGYVPLPPAALLTVGRRLEKHVSGSAFGAHGSVLGLTPDVFQDDERIKNALVR